MLATPIEEKRTNHSGKVTPAPKLSPDESAVFEFLEPYPVHIDDISRKLDMEPAKISSLLLQLELKGVVRQSPGKHFSINIK